MPEPCAARFEYSVQEINLSHLQLYIGRMAAQGWRVSSTLPLRPNVASVIFERPIAATPEPTPEDRGNQLYTTAQVAERLGVSPATIKNLVYEHELPVLTVAGKFRFLESDIIEFIARRRSEAGVGIAGEEEGPLVRRGLSRARSRR